MRTAEVIERWGSAAAVAEKLGITRQAVSLWRETVPPLRVYQIRELIEAEEREKSAPPPEQAAA
jgi:predicted transcriptional regulator